MNTLLALLKLLKLIKRFFAWLGKWSKRKLSF